jgi:hypothetical protein
VLILPVTSIFEAYERRFEVLAATAQELQSLGLEVAPIAGGNDKTHANGSPTGVIKLASLQQHEYGSAWQLFYGAAGGAPLAMRVTRPNGVGTAVVLQR